MKKVDLPLLGSELRIYAPAEKEAFLKVCDGLASDVYGCCFGSSLWIGNEKGKKIEGIVAHELSHYVDWLIETRLEVKAGTLDSVGELRAYIMQYLYPIVLDYVKEEI